MQTCHIQNTKQKERVVLTIYVLYTMGLAGMAYRMNWNPFIAQIILAGMAASLLFHVRQYKDYPFRAVFTSCMIWMNIAIYGCLSPDMSGVYATMCCLIALIGIYGIAEMTHIGLAVFVFLMLYHASDMQEQYLSSQGTGKIKMFLQISSIFLTSYAVCFLNKQQETSNENLLGMIETLEKAQQSKNDFMANISHEIRTPINTVCGISEVIMGEKELPEQARRDILDIQTAGQHLLSVINDILDFSELETGKMELAEEAYNITSTVNDVMNAAISKNSEKNLEIIVDCDASLPVSLLGDEQKIRRIISNVMDNAIKFTNEGGILFSLSAREESYGINLLITISDTGIGMNQEELENLFTSFSQVNARRNRPSGGIGLGLAISQAIVERMGGFITVSSTAGKGSSVQVVIPQKVLDRSPIVSIKNRESLRVLGYIDIEKYDFSLIRSGYTSTIRHIAESLDVPFVLCRNLTVLKRHVKKERFSHVFMSSAEYDQDREYFNELSLNSTVAVVLDREYGETQEIGENILPLYKPFYVIPVASVLNKEIVVQNTDGSRSKVRHFVAPEAKVLIVDDNSMNLRVMEGLLKPYQIQVSMVESGREALKKLEGQIFDFVFMDHMMPGMDGVETLHRIRQKSGHYFKTVPVIALTANAIGGAREMFLAEGFADFVAKPVETSVLERVLRRHIPKEKQRKARDAIEPAGQIPRQTGAENLLGNEEDAQELYLEGIDVAMGMGFCGGSIDDYVEVARIYHANGQSKWKDIQKAHEEKDWKTYSIYAHSIKSMSMGIGAVALSDIAKGLEAAGKEGREDYIDAHNGELLAEYERVLGVIGRNPMIFPNKAQDKPNLAEISKGRLLDELERLRGKLETFESDGVDEALTRLLAYQFENEPLTDLLGGVKEKAGAFDFMGAGEDLAAIVEKMRQDHDW